MLGAGALRLLQSVLLTGRVEWRRQDETIEEVCVGSNEVLLQAQPMLALQIAERAAAATLHLLLEGQAIIPIHVPKCGARALHQLQLAVRKGHQLSKGDFCYPPRWWCLAGAGVCTCVPPGRVLLLLLGGSRSSHGRSHGPARCGGRSRSRCCRRGQCYTMSCAVVVDMRGIAVLVLLAALINAHGCCPCDPLQAGIEGADGCCCC